MFKKPVFTYPNDPPPPPTRQRSTTIDCQIEADPPNSRVNSPASVETHGFTSNIDVTLNPPQARVSCSCSRFTSRIFSIPHSISERLRARPT